MQGESLRVPGLGGRIAVVTGASRGIGRAIATALARQGARVVATATSPAGAEAISGYFEQAGLTGRGAVLDVGSDESVSAFAGEVSGREGPPLVLVNNAGITRDNLLLRMKSEEWDEIINVNLGSVYRMTHAVLRGMMKSRWGRIVNIGSVVGSMGNPGQANYAAAKAGMAGFARALAREVGSRGITVNTVAPGFIDTDMTRALDENQRRAIEGQIALGRLGEAEEVASLVAYLVSDAGAYITGETLHVNGGLYMT